MKNYFRQKYREENWKEKIRREPFKPLMDPEVVKAFLLGDYCLHGGTGWWKYEFCYGKFGRFVSWSVFLCWYSNETTYFWFDLN